MELGRKLEAALVAYLQTLDTYPEYFDKTAQIKPGEEEEDIDQQYIRCRSAEQADEEYPLDTGNYWWDCEVQALTPCLVPSPADSEPSQLDKHQAVAAALEDAISIDNLPSLLTAAAEDLGEGYELTVFATQNRQPGRAQDDQTYSSGWTFRVYCCSRAF